MGQLFLNLNSKNSNRLLSKYSQEWTLCLGAGINKNILPDWSTLTLNVVNKVFKFGWDNNQFEKNNKIIGFSFDSWIQASLNKYLQEGNKIDSFIKILENEIYGDLLKEAENKGIKNEMINFLNKPQMKRTHLNKVLKFFENEYSDTTLMQIIDTLTSDSKRYKYPGSIITFNADTLLYSLLIGYNEKKYSTLYIPKASEPYKLMLKSYHAWGDKIPIFQLHGSMFPEQVITKKVKSKKEDGRENLIFLESSYTKVAGSMFTWAQTNFLYYALNSKIVFLGLSMSDPNIRKWLNWTNETINADLIHLKNDTVFANRHLWMKPKPKDNEIQVYLENSLTHLGVKVGWIDNYGEVKNSLLNIMEI